MKDLKELNNYKLDCSYQDDLCLQYNLKQQVPANKQEYLDQTLQKWTAHLPLWDHLASEAARPEKLPRIEKYDFVGNLVEKVVLPLETQILRREVVEAGIFKNQNQQEFFAKVYLLAQLGESGVTCPLACTDGLIRSISELGSPLLKETYLPLLQSSKHPLSGAQFITEQTGGSDVGAILGTAKPTDQGHWLLSADKWYCSAIDEFFLVAARPEGAPTGTKGIAIFFVPRLKDPKDPYSVNHLSIKRLKNKLGTQSLPTAEVEFSESIAHPIGKVESGFDHLMNYVLNISRIHNSANCLGILRRAIVESRNYASQRVAFEKTLLEFPLIQESLLSLIAHHYGKLCLFFELVGRVEKNGVKPNNNEENLWQRCLINLLKYRTAACLSSCVKEAILVMGANGIIEDFSILPRLLRDSLIVETWEGPHNILCLQILKDMRRFHFFDHLEKEWDKISKIWPENILPRTRKIYTSALIQMKKEMGSKLADKAWAQQHIRNVVDFWGDFLEIGSLIKQGLKPSHHNLLFSAALLTHLKLQNRFESLKSPLLELDEKIKLDLICEKPTQVDLESL